MDDAGLPKVFACFCGHHHLDRYRLKDCIHYVWLNSASYYWVGADYGRMAFYRDALFTYLTFRGGNIEIAPRQTSWSKPTPKDRGYPDWEDLNTVIRKRRLA